MREVCSADRAAQIFNAPFIDAGRMENVTADCGPNKGATVELAQADRAGHSVLNALGRDCGDGHEGVEVGYVIALPLLDAPPLPPHPFLLPVPLADDDEHDQGGNQEQPSCHIGQDHHQTGPVEAILLKLNLKGAAPSG